MRNIRKINLALLAVVAIICSAQLSEGNEEYPNNYIRVRVLRSPRDSEKKTSDKHTKKDNAATRSQQNVNQEINEAELEDNNGAFRSTESEPSPPPVRIAGKFLGGPPGPGGFPNNGPFSNGPGGFPNNSPFMPPPMRSYAASYPYPGMPYPPPPQVPVPQYSMNVPGPIQPETGAFFFGSPSFQPTGINPGIQNGNNFLRPPVGNAPYANNFLTYDTYPMNQQGPSSFSATAGPQYSVHNLQTAPSSLQLQGFAHRQQDYIPQPMPNGFPYVMPHPSPDYGIPPNYYPTYPRFQRSLDVKDDE